jgi:hypothetical protein
MKKKRKESRAKPEQEKYPHFRFYEKSKHPALITGERPIDEYNYRKVTSSEKDGRHINEKVTPNPDKTRKTPMYIGKHVKHDKKNNFSKWKYPWKYPKKKK